MTYFDNRIIMSEGEGSNGFDFSKLDEDIEYLRKRCPLPNTENWISVLSNMQSRKGLNNTEVLKGFKVSTIHELNQLRQQAIESLLAGDQGYVNFLKKIIQQENVLHILSNAIIRSAKINLE